MSSIRKIQKNTHNYIKNTPQKFIKAYLILMATLPNIIQAQTKLTIEDCAKYEEYIAIDKNESPIRLTPAEEGKVHVLKFSDKGVSSATIEEKKRDKKIVSDLKIIPNIIDGVAIVPEKTCAKYIQQKPYSLAELKTTSIDGEKTYDLILGPAEHTYLSADMVVTKLKQLKYDQTTNSVSEKSTPSNFFVGINYKIGDIYTTYKWNDTKNISLKLNLNVSNKPLNAAGFGIGYSLPFGTVFIARIKTTSDDSSTKWNTSFGISLEMQKAANWITSSN